MGSDLSVSISAGPYALRLGSRFGLLKRTNPYDLPEFDNNLYAKEGKLSQGFNLGAEVSYGQFVLGYQYDLFSASAEIRLGNPVDPTVQAHLLVLGLDQVRDLNGNFDFRCSVRAKVGYGRMTYAGKTKYGASMGSEFNLGIFLKTGDVRIGISNPIRADFVQGIYGHYYTLLNPTLVFGRNF